MCVGMVVELLAFRVCVEAEVVDTLGMKVRIANAACQLSASTDALVPLADNLPKGWLTIVADSMRNS